MASERDDFAAKAEALGAQLATAATEAASAAAADKYALQEKGETSIVRTHALQTACAREPYFPRCCPSGLHARTLCSA